MVVWPGSLINPPTFLPIFPAVQEAEGLTGAAAAAALQAGADRVRKELQMNLQAWMRWLA